MARSSPLRSIAGLLALLPLLAGCGARSDLSVPAPPGPPPVTTTCTLKLGLPAARIFPEIEDDSESLFASFAATREGDEACFLSFLDPHGDVTTALHARCMRAWGALDRGPDVVIGGTMSDHGSVPPAYVSIATSATHGYAIVYGDDLGYRFAPAMAPGDDALPTTALPSTLRPLALGPPALGGNLLVHEDQPTGRMAATRLLADGSMGAETTLFCAGSGAQQTRTIRVGAADLVAARSIGGSPACPGSSFGSIDVAAIGEAIVIGSIAGAGPVSSFALTPAGADQAWLVLASSAASGARLEAVLLDAGGHERRRFDLEPAAGGYGVAAAQLGGALLVIMDSERTIGDMSSTAGLTAILVDPSGAVVSRLDVPLDVPLLDSPEMPAIVTSADGKQALLGFFTQPTGKGGRDYLARIDCVDP